jgi:hypothetical protein
MRVSFNVSNAKSVKEFFSQDVDFLDIYVTERVLFVISNRIDIYSHLVFEVVSREDFSDPVSFRVDRKEFLSMLSDGTVSFYVNPTGYVETFFRSGDISYSMRRPYQSSDMTQISTILSVLNYQERFVHLKLQTLQKYMSLLRSFNFINISEGLLSAFHDNTFVYIKVDAPNVSISTQSLHYILKFSDRIHGYQNFVIGRTDYSVIIAKRSKSNFEADFEFIHSRKSSHRIKFDATNICALARRCGSDSIVTIDFDRESCTIENKNRKFNTKFKVHELISAKDKKESNKEISLDDFDFSNTSPVVVMQKAPNLVFPIKMFKDILPSVQGRSNVTLYIKKQVVQFEIGKELYIVSGRRESKDDL